MNKIGQFVTACLMAVALVFAAGINEEAHAFEETHTVSYGDSLWEISNWYDVSLSELRSLNHIWDDLIYPGQTIAIPATKQTSEQQSETREIKAQTNSNSTQRLEVSDYELNLMAQGVYSEARGEPYEGQVAVASVIINRVSDNRWPGNVEGVIFEPWAFTPVHDGQFWLTPDDTAYQAVQDALNGWDPTGGATFFYNPQTATSSWIFTRNTITQIGSHRFAY